MTENSHSHLHFDAVFIEKIMGSPCGEAIYDDQTLSLAEFRRYSRWTSEELLERAEELQSSDPVAASRLRTIGSALVLGRFQRLTDAGRDFIWTEGLALPQDGSLGASLLIVTSADGVVSLRATATISLGLES